MTPLDGRICACQLSCDVKELAAAYILVGREWLAADDHVKADIVTPCCPPSSMGIHSH